jgi:hypothetical protein
MLEHTRLAAAAFEEEIVILHKMMDDDIQVRDDLQQTIRDYPLINLEDIGEIMLRKEDPDKAAKHFGFEMARYLALYCLRQSARDRSDVTVAIKAGEVLERSEDTLREMLADEV